MAPGEKAGRRDVSARARRPSCILCKVFRTTEERGELFAVVAESLGCADDVTAHLRAAFDFGAGHEVSAQWIVRHGQHDPDFREAMRVARSFGKEVARLRARKVRRVLASRLDTSVQESAVATYRPDIAATAREGSHQALTANGYGAAARPLLTLVRSRGDGSP